MNKQQTIETLQKQLPSFYSLEQVINIINGIEDNNGTLNDKLINTIVSNITSSLHNSCELVNNDSAEFELDYDNRITLSNIDVDVDQIVSIIRDELNEFNYQSNDVVELELGE
jgi:hypothetical protein